MHDFLQKLFERLRTSHLPMGQPVVLGQDDRQWLLHAVEHVVEHVSHRFRAIGTYPEQLLPSVAKALHHIDSMIEAVPGGFVCSRDNYVRDRRVNAFFVSPGHLSEVFSASRALRQLFETNPALDSCWGLLCMRRQQQQRFGMDMMGNTLVRDVRQQVISFTDHQLLSPGDDEEAARKALKCCIFNNLLDYAKGRIEASRANSDWYPQASGEIAFRRQGFVLPLNKQLQLLVDILDRPEEFMSLREERLSLDRMGVVRQGKGQVSESLDITEIELVEKGSRVAALVGFRRQDLLPCKDLARNADIFLAM